MVSYAERNEPHPVRRREVQVIRLRLVRAEDLLLQLDDGLHGLPQRVEHMRRRVRLALPRLLARAVGKIRDVQRREVFGVGSAGDVRVGVERQKVAEGPADGEEVGDEAVVHEGVAAEGEGVVVDGGGGGGSCGANVCEAGRRGRVGADRAEVQVVEGGLRGAVEGGAAGCGLGWVGFVTVIGVVAGSIGVDRERGARVGVPCYADAVDVEEPVFRADLVLGGDVFGVVGEEVGEVVLVHLLGEGVGL